MNVPCRQAYARTAQFSSPREIEAQTLLMAARKLVEVQTNWNGPDKKMHAALLFNRRLWTIFMSAAESNDNPQPLEVRQNILNIAVFVMQRTIEMQTNPDSGKAAIADRHQLQYCRGPVGQGLIVHRPTGSRLRCAVAAPSTGSGLAIGGERRGASTLGQIERAKIGAAAQHRVVRKLIDHRVGALVDRPDRRSSPRRDRERPDAIRNRSRPGSLRAPALASTTVTLWLGGSSVATALLAASLTGCATGVATGAPTGLMLKSVLMAASWLPSSQIPTPPIAIMTSTSQRCVRECAEFCADFGAQV